jgi:hypothetical protein
MLGENQFFQRGEFCLLRFQNQQNLRAGFNLSLPPVMRFDFWDEVRARNQARLQRRARERTGNFQIGRGDHYNGEFCGGFHFIANGKFAAYL